MPRLDWDKDGERFFETGVRRGVLYQRNASGAYVSGVEWNGLTGVTESPSGAEATALYADDMKYLNMISAEEFGGTIEAYYYPDEFMENDGSAAVVDGVVIGQQTRKTFGLCYRTEVGNDVDGNEHGYKLHLLYGCLASPSERSYATINDSPEAITFSWEFTTTPVTVGKINGVDYKPTALVVIDSRFVDEDKLTAFEDILYGTDPDTDAGTEGTVASLPLPAAVIAHFTPSNPGTI